MNIPYVGTVLAKLNDFLQQKDKLLVNRWIEANGVTVYVRVTVHIADGQTKRTLDIANVVVDGQNQGKFTAFLKGAEEAASKEPTIDGMYIENVQTAQLCDFFRRQGYHEIPSLDGNHCYYKPLKEN